jgi:hypothetical protein
VKGFRILILSGLFFFPGTGSPLWGQADVFPSSLVVGVSQWRNQGVPGEYSYLIRTIPAQLLAAAAGCEDHQIGEPEQQAMREKLAERRKEALEKEVSRLRRTLDEMLFDPSKSEEDRARAHEAWETRLTEWRLSGDDSPAPSQLPAKIALGLHEKNSQDQFLPVFFGPAETYPDKTDYLVHGGVEMVEGILSFTMGVFSFWEGRNLVWIERAYLPEEAGGFIEEARLVMIDTLLGRDWASLSVKTNESGASLSLNGVGVGRGGVNLPYLVPGTYQVHARAPGYQGETVEIELYHRQRETLEIELKPLDWPSFNISTIPEGADLYLGSRWLGQSPWEGSLPPENTILSIRKPGYRETSRYLPEKRKEGMEILLPVESFKVEHLMETHKKRFYSSLGAFVLALPVPFILQGISQYSAQAWYNENSLYGSNDETDRLRRISLLSYYGSQGALFIQGALFVNMVIDAVRYVKTTDLMFTR